LLDEIKTIVLRSQAMSMYSQQGEILRELYDLDFDYEKEDEQ